MKYLKTYKIFEAKKSKSKVEEIPTEYFTMGHILDILQDFVDEGKVDIISGPNNNDTLDFYSTKSDTYVGDPKYLNVIDCLQTYVNGKQYVSWQTFDEVRQTLQKWNVKNCFGNSDKGSNWRSEYYIYNPIIEQAFAKLVGECRPASSGDGLATFYIGKGDTCHFIAVNNGEESEYQIGSNKHFLVSTKIWDHFTSAYSMDNKMTQRLLKHLVGRYFNLKMDGNLMWPDKYGYVIEKKDTQKIYKDNMGIDEKRKVFESTDEWRRNTSNQELKDLSYELDDILHEISDEGFPTVQPPLIDDRRQTIQIELTSSEDGSVSGYDEFTITKSTESVLRRLQNCAEVNNYNISIGLYFIYPSQSTTDSFYISYDGNNWIVIDKKIDSYEKNNPFDGVDFEVDKALDIIGIDVDFIAIEISSKG